MKVDSLTLRYLLSKELNQLGGLSINRSQNININANLDRMSKDDIKERLGKLLGQKSRITHQRISEMPTK